MAQGNNGGRLVLYVLLGIVAVVVGVQVLSWLIGAALTLLWYALVTAVVVGVAMLVIRASRRPIGGRDRGRLPR